MAQKQLVTRTEFSKLAGVSASAITKACKHELAPATSAGRVDKAHESAIAYLAAQAKKTETPLAAGLDDRHNEAARWCAINSCYAGRALAKGIGISRDRASKIVKTLTAMGLPLKDGAKVVEMATPPQDRIISGQEKAKLTKKTARTPEQYEPEDMLLQVPEDIRQLANWSLRDLVTKFGTDVAFLDWLKATKALEDIHEKRLKNAKSSGELVDREQIKISVIEPINTAHVKLLTDGAKTIAVRTKAMLDAGRDLGEVELFITEQISSFIKPMKARVARGLKNA